MGHGVQREDGGQRLVDLVFELFQPLVQLGAIDLLLTDCP